MNALARDPLPRIGHLGEADLLAPVRGRSAVLAYDDPVHPLGERGSHHHAVWLPFAEEPGSQPAADDISQVHPPGSRRAGEVEAGHLADSAVTTVAPNQERRPQPPGPLRGISDDLNSGAVVVNRP